MPTIRKNSDIFKGSALQVTVGGQVLGFATSHALSITVNTTEVSSKDHGDYPGVIKQNTTWEITCENLFCGHNWDDLQELLDDDTPVNISFVSISNYTSKGIVQPETGDPIQPTAWEIGKTLASGQAFITSLNVNAGMGDNATISATFTGAGPLTFTKISESNSQGGATGEGN
jgi:hypothetical protein